MLDYIEKAAAHEQSGGVRAAYVDGWQTGERGEGLFRAMKRYDGAAQKSFIEGWHDFDTAASVEST